MTIKRTIRSLLIRSIPDRWLIERGPDGVALTFDDGPDPEITPLLLDRLSDAGICATFFVIGQKVQAAPHLVRRMIDEGHAVGNHTWSHREPSGVTPSEFAEELRRTDAILADLSGLEPTAVRPPKGELGLGKFVRSIRGGSRIVLWTADPRDYRLTSSEPLCRWVGSYRPTAGEIVLLHDNHPWCLDAVAHFAAWRDRFGLPFRTIDDWSPSTARVRPPTPSLREPTHV